MQVVTGTKLSAVAAALIVFAALKVAFGSLRFVVGILGLPFGV